MKSPAPSAGATRHIGSLMMAAVLSGQPVCFDSAPLIDYIARLEPTRSLLRPLLTHPDVPVVISTITLTEVTTRPAANGDHSRVIAIRDALRALPALNIADFDQRHAIETAVVRALTGLKLPDAAVVATARLSSASAIIGNDRQWKNKPLGVPYHHMDDILALP